MHQPPLTNSSCLLFTRVFTVAYAVVTGRDETGQQAGKEPRTPAWRASAASTIAGKTPELVCPKPSATDNVHDNAYAARVQTCST